MKLIEGQVALVTGASRGLGVAIARNLAQRGIRLVLSARSASELETVARLLQRETGIKIIVVPSDISQPEAIFRLAEEAQLRAGAIDVLVNNAGMDRPLAFNQRSATEIQQMVDVNLTAPMLLTREILPGMIARKRGHIVNIASVGGLIAGPFEEPYNATKFGLVGFTRSLRMSSRVCNWNVGSSVICPGFVEGAGIFEDMKRKYSIKAPKSMPAVPIEEVGKAVVRAIERNLPDVIVSRGTQKTFTALSILAPRFFERAAARSSVANLFRSVADRNVRPSA